MAQLQKGTTYITGDQVTAANLNALVDSGILTPGAVTDQTAKTVPLAADTILLHSAADTALRKTTMTQLFATPQPLGATTPSSVAATTGTFSSTLGVTGVATLGNGAILGTPASGTVTNLTGTASININGTVGATTPSTIAATTISATGATRITTNNVYFAGTTTGAANQNLIGVGGDDNTYIQYKSGQSARFSNGVSNQVEISGTGAAITGTLSATGNATLTGTNTVLNLNGSNYGMVSTGTGNLYLSVPSTKSVIMQVASSDYLVLTSTGAAITGAVTSTGSLKSSNAGGGALELNGTNGNSQPYIYFERSSSSVWNMGLSSDASANFIIGNGYGGGNCILIAPSGAITTSNSLSVTGTVTATVSSVSTIALKAIEGSNTGGFQFRLGNNDSTYNYDIGRSVSTGYLQFYGNQTGAIGYVFGGASGTYATLSSTSLAVTPAASANSVQGSGGSFVTVVALPAGWGTVHVAAAENGTTNVGYYQVDFVNGTGIAIQAKTGTTAGASTAQLTFQLSGSNLQARGVNATAPYSVKYWIVTGTF